MDEDELIRKFSDVTNTSLYPSMLAEAIEQDDLLSARVLMFVFHVQPTLMNLARATSLGHFEVVRLIFDRLGDYRLDYWDRNSRNVVEGLARTQKIATLREMIRRGYFSDWNGQIKNFFVGHLVTDLSATDDESSYDALRLFLLDAKFPWVHPYGDNVIWKATTRSVLENLYTILLPLDSSVRQCVFLRAVDLGMVDFCQDNAKHVNRSCLHESLVRAIRLSEWDIVTWLLRDAVPPVTVKDSHWSENALDTAIDVKSIRAMELLLQHEYCLSLRRYFTNCIRQNYADGLRVLLARCSEPMRPSFLLEACALENVAVARLLLEFGANPDATTWGGKIIGRYPGTVCNGNRAILHLLDERRRERRVYT